MLHIYGIIGGSSMAVNAHQGHQGDDLAAFPVMGLAAVVSDATRPPSRWSVDDVWRHEKILGALMEQHAVLPMRFGTVSTSNELAVLLHERHSALSTALKKVAGKVEMAVRILAGPLPPAGAGSQPLPIGSGAISGKAYLEARLARSRRTQSKDISELGFAADIMEHLTRHSVNVVWGDAQPMNDALKVSCLIDRENIDDFVGSLEEFQRQQRLLSCTGPWAPYSFIDRAATLGTVR